MPRFGYTAVSTSGFFLEQARVDMTVGYPGRTRTGRGLHLEPGGVENWRLPLFADILSLA